MDPDKVSQFSLKMTSVPRGDGVLTNVCETRHGSVGDVLDRVWRSVGQCPAEDQNTEAKSTGSIEEDCRETSLRIR
jgi:hypothetical protein